MEGGGETDARKVKMEGWKASEGGEKSSETGEEWWLNRRRKGSRSGEERGKSDGGRGVLQGARERTHPPEGCVSFQPFNVFN